MPYAQEEQTRRYQASRMALQEFTIRHLEVEIDSYVEAEPRQQLIDAKARLQELEEELWREQGWRGEAQEDVRALREELDLVQAELAWHKDAEVMALEPLAA